MQIVIDWIQLWNIFTFSKKLRLFVVFYLIYVFQNWQRVFCQLMSAVFQVLIKVFDHLTKLKSGKIVHFLNASGFFYAQFLQFWLFGLELDFYSWIKLKKPKQKPFIFV